MQLSTSQRVVLNACATYGRTVLGIALGLFSSRWVLQSLGKVDYGLMGVVGSLIVFITFFNGVAAGSCSRFFAFSIGRKDEEELNRWFNVALSVHIILPAILVAIGWPICEWAIDHFINIPPDRVRTAHWVFRFSLFTAFQGMATTPYRAMYTATQNIAERTLWDLGSMIIRFFFIWWLTTYKGDAWFLLAAFTVLLATSFNLGQSIRAAFIYKACKIRFEYWFDKAKLRAIFSFSAWTLFGSLGYMARSQCPAIFLNKYFPPKEFPEVNASFSIGTSLAGYSNTLSSALMGAFQPEITTREGRGDRAGVVRAANRASKFGATLMLLIAVPVALEADYVLKLWLRTPPEFASVFCRLVLLQFILDNLTFGHMVGIIATGRIALYQFTTGMITMLCIPVAWVWLELGGGPECVSWAIAICMACCSIARLIFGRTRLQIPIRIWAKDVLARVFAGSATAGLAGWAVLLLFPHPSFLRVVSTSFCTTAVMGAMGWFVVCTAADRELLIANFGKAIARKFHK